MGGKGRGKGTGDARSWRVKAVPKGDVQEQDRTPGDMEAIAEAFMQSAACSALAGVRMQHGGPFGAAIVRDGVLIACAHNMVLHCGDPTKHAEMCAIQQACKALGSHDLSDCDLYTTCEPCPMCWGAVRWARLDKIHLGVDRYIAAKYGFDDKVFYDEVEAKSAHMGIRSVVSNHAWTQTSIERRRSVEHMVRIYSGVMREDVLQLFMDPGVNKTLLRRYGSADGKKMHDKAKELFCAKTPTTADALSEDERTKHAGFMRLAMKAATTGAKRGLSKEREPFGVVIVKDNVVIAEAHNTVLESRDCTATAEVNAIRIAADRLDTHILEDCCLYCTAFPDLMSFGAILWARISTVYCGVSQQEVAQMGFEDGMAHFKELLSGKHKTNVIENVAVKDCEAVFKEWSEKNGAIY